MGCLQTIFGTAALIYASNEPKSVLARDLSDCRDNLRNSRSVFLIVFRAVVSLRLHKLMMKFRGIL